MPLSNVVLRYLTLNKGITMIAKTYFSLLNITVTTALLVSLTATAWYMTDIDFTTRRPVITESSSGMVLQCVRVPETDAGGSQFSRDEDDQEEVWTVRT